MRSWNASSSRSNNFHDHLTAALTAVDMLLLVYITTALLLLDTPVVWRRRESQSEIHIYTKIYTWRAAQGQQCATYIMIFDLPYTGENRPNQQAIDFPESTIH